jgi:predicted GH43/DUF377 family glycosyl hydrolase
MRLSRPFQVLRPSGPFAGLDRHRAWRPSVLQGDGRSWRMWYSGHDGSTSRVLGAEQRRDSGWVRSGVSVDAGLAGWTDSAGIDAPSVVRLPAGFVMAYVGSDGKTARVHLATSDDGRSWRPSGPFRAPDGRDATGSPCLVAAGGSLQIFYASPGSGGRSAVFGATSSDGASWRDAGPVLESQASDHGVSDPWVVTFEEGLLMLFVRGREDRGFSVGVATSCDGRAWSRHPALVDLARRHHDGGVISGPSALHLGGRHLRVWYAAETEGDTTGYCRLWSADLVGAVP